MALRHRYQAMTGIAISAVILAAPSAFAAHKTSASNSTGKIRIFVTPVSSTLDKILITGAIGDFGKAITIDKAGKTDANGSYAKVELSKGGFELNATSFDAALRRLSPSMNTTTCSVSGQLSGAVTLFDGTGSYKGISGTPSVTFRIGEILPRHASGTRKGQCNFSESAEPLSHYESLIGSGSVRLSK